MPITPPLVAVMVFWRKFEGSGPSHVGFYFVDCESSYHIIGGNQSDIANAARPRKNHLLAARRPVTAFALVRAKRSASEGVSLHQLAATLFARGLAEL